ncbi:MAG TPA: non-canonical purine NTP pyrophosphatase [Gemmatimonadaceae bacterium]|nr:non-canonical purine NTP pyrophosphatase [Gemmatimonadaceae bacterium]
MSATALLLATRSAGKVREIAPMFTAAGLTLVSLGELGIDESEEEDQLECYDTFEDNALAKARYFFEVSGGIPTIADDSGLEVDALGGRPGVASKRWSGRTDLRGAALDAANNQTLITALAGLNGPAARYVCVAAYVAVGLELTARGETSGTIVPIPRGTGGFGYDPYFMSSDLGRTFGEATVQEKEAVSHRGRAFRALLARIRSGS